MPPPAEIAASRLFLGPALRTQPDRRLVALVRAGYESAFEEIVRRYGKPLTRYAAAIVGSRGEDVTQDAFSKALLALRRNDTEIELRPWLFRIVRNTALNDLRDSPPMPELLAEAIAGGESPAETLERREELTDLMHRLRSLPEAQRAAIVMREMEGLSHEEIATALGVSGGAARQAIHRARQALRDGAGMLVPLPLLKALLAAGSMGTAEVAAGAGGTVGAGVALKAVTASVLVAGAVGAGVAIHDGRHSAPHQRQPAAVRSASQDEAVVAPAPTAPATATSDDRSGRGRGDDAGRGKGEPGDDRGHGKNERGDDHGGQREESGGDDGGGPGSGDDHESGVESGDRHGGSSGSGRGGGEDGHSGSSGGSGHGSGGSSGHGSSGSGHDGESSGHGGGPGPSDHSGGGVPSDDLASDGGGGSSGGPGPSEAQVTPETSGGSESGGGDDGSSEGSGSGGSSGSGSGSGDDLSGD
jgi:RNA polymerase sigma factor (sigma-70 family)